MINKKTSKMFTFLLAIGLLAAAMPVSAQEKSVVPADPHMKRLFRIGGVYFGSHVVYNIGSFIKHLCFNNCKNKKNHLWQAGYWTAVNAVLLGLCCKAQAKS